MYTKLKDFLIESLNSNTYEVEYYDNGEHGSFRVKSIADGIVRCKEIMKEKSFSPETMWMLDVTEYDSHNHDIGGVVVFATQPYIDYLQTIPYAKTEEVKTAYENALKECVKTGRPTYFTYPVNTNEKFASKAQQRYFYAMAGKGGKKGKKFKAMAKEFSDKTDFENLPDKVNESASEEIKDVLKKVEGANIHPHEITDRYEIKKDKFRDAEIAKEKKKELEKDGWSTKIKKVSFEGRDELYFLTAVREKIKESVTHRKTKDWLVVIYDKNDNIIDAFEILDRTEYEADNEAEEKVNLNRKMADWTMTPTNSEIGKNLKKDASKFLKESANIWTKML